MKHHLAFFLLLFSFCGFTQDWLETYEQSVEHYNLYQMNDARTSAEEALRLYRESVSEPHKNETAILRQLTLICYETADYESGLEYAKKEVEMLQQLGLDSDMNYANALNNLGLIRSARSEYEAAKPLLKKAYDIALQYNTSESEEIAVLRGNYGIVLFQLKDDETAEYLLGESIKTLQKLEYPPADFYNILYNFSALREIKADYNTALQGYKVLENFYAYDAPNMEYGSILIKSGNALDNLGNFAEAAEKYRQAIDNFEQIGQEESPEYAIAQNNLSIGLQRLGKYEEAENLVKNLLAKRASEKENNPSAYAITATNYGILLLRKGEINEANEYFSEVKDIYTKNELTKDLVYTNMLESYSSSELSQGNLENSSALIEEAIEIGEENSFSGNLHSYYNQKAKVLLRQAQYQEAKEAGKKALALAQRYFGTGSIQAGYVQNALAGIYSELGNYEQADKLYASSLPIFKAKFGEDHPEYATSAANYSSLQQLMGNYSSAEKYLKQANEIKKAAFGENNLDYLATYENLGLLYISTARYTEAQRILNEVKEKKEQLLESDDPSLAYTYANLANIKKQVAEYTESESYFSKAEKILASSLGKEHLQYASTINNLALLYQKMGNLEAAKPYFEEAMEIYEAKLGRLSPDYATALENLATLYQMEGDIIKSKELLEEALIIDEKILGKNHPLYSKTLHNLASIYEDTEEYEKSRDLYEQSLAIDEKIYGKNHPSYASTLYNLAVLEQELENFDQAKTYYQQVADTRKNILGENHPDYAYSIYGLASVNQRTGNYEEAKGNYEIVIEKYLENIREYFPALSETEKSAFYGKIRPVFEAFMDFAVEYVITEQGTAQDRTNMLGQLYDLQLSTKALLLNATNKVRNRILSSGDPELIGLFQEWIALKENIVKSLSLSKEEIEQNQVDIAAMQSKANDMEKQLSLKSSLFAQEFEKEAITWQDVKEALQPQEAALEVIRIKKNLKNDSILYATLVIESVPEAKPRLILISNGDELESKIFKTYKNSIVYKVTDKKSYNSFWKAIDEEISNKTKNIYLSADGIYNKVNISTLLDDQGKYVIDKYNIRLLSNTKELVEKQNDSAGQNEAEMFGFPTYNLEKKESEKKALIDSGGMRYSFGDNVSELPGTLEEIKNIGKLMDKNAWTYKTYLENQATEENIKKLNSPKIFHVATHGFFLEDISIDENSKEGIDSRNMKFNPLMRSGLLFAGAENTIREEDIPGNEDGILTAYEAMNLNLDHTELVVMSACETGLGEVKNGEGVYGLQRAFIVAGAQNLIMSLWKVNDETTQLLMSSFYEEWFSGKTKTEAFTSAIQNVKKKFNDPYYWGAFVMLGK